MKSAALHNLGCKVNGYELEVMQQMLAARGYQIVPFDSKADIYIVNTCTVTNIADRKSRQMLHRARRMNPEAVVVAVGCYVQADKEDIMRDEGIDLLIGNNRKKDLAEILENYLEHRGDKTLEETTVVDIAKEKEYEEMQLVQTGEHTRTYIKIQDGCNQFCTYCIIPHVRGRVRSRKPEDILTEIRGLAEKGYQEAVLTGIHISSYGADHGDPALLSLIRQVHEIPGLKRIRIGSLEPRIITREFAEGLARLPKICPHFHLSLQSGCDLTLKRMNRRYTTREYYEKVELLREVFDAPGITTDVIVGFPGETEEEFESSRSFVEKVGFSEMHVFKYSKRKGTPAAEMADQIPEEVKSARSGILMEAGRRSSAAFRQSYIGREVEVLYEEARTEGDTVYQTGYSREYIRIVRETGEDLGNTILRERVSGLWKEDCLLV